MDELLFILTFILTIVFTVRLIIKLFKRQEIAKTSKIISSILVLYTLIWLVFYISSKKVVVSYGTEICFDDWCATVIDAKRTKVINKQTSKETFVILKVKLINKAKRIALKPSMPRIKIIDDDGNEWMFSEAGQNAYEQKYGKQAKIDKKLEHQETCVTNLVFEIPSSLNKAYALIEEGPFITKLFIKDDERIFGINSITE